MLRGAAAAAFTLHLTPSEPGWIDMALGVPTMSTDRTPRELGFVAERTGEEALLELTGGLRDAATGNTPTLGREPSGPVRLRELLTSRGPSIAVRDQGLT